MLDLKPTADLVLAGMRPEQIAENLGVTLSAVWHRIHRARTRGMIPTDFIVSSAKPRKPPKAIKLASHASLASLRNRGHVVIGGGGAQLLESLPLPVLNWLIAGIPPGLTVNEMLRAIIIDAYNDEVGA